MDRETVCAIGICGIVVIECVALYYGVNGVLLSSALSGIGLVIGYLFGVKSGKR